MSELRRVPVAFVNLPDRDAGAPLGRAQQTMQAPQTALYRLEGSMLDRLAPAAAGLELRGGARRRVADVPAARGRCYHSRVSRPPLPVALLVAVSGFCSLIYQVVWERILRYNFGGDSISAAIVTGTFLLGLGLGAVVFGRWRRDAIRLYALVEAGIGLYGLASFYLLAPLSTVLGALFATDITAVEGLRPAVVVAAVLFLLPPCILIGGTGPLIFNCFIRPAAYPPHTVGLLYGVNTLGAALGVLAAPFLLLNRFSIPVTLALIALGNLGLAAGIWRYGIRHAADDDHGATEDHGPAGAPAAGAGSAGRPLLALAFASGFISLAFEVGLVRVLFVHNPSSPYNFPAMLIPFLAALAAGSALLTRFTAYDDRRALARVGWLFVGAVAAMLGAVLASAGLLLAGFRPLALPPGAAALAFLTHAVLLSASLPLFLGAVLPLLLRLAAPTGRVLPAKTGPLFLANSAGAFTGALLTQFVGFPAVGTRGVLITLLLLGLAVGGFCLWRASAGSPGMRPVALAPLPLLALAPVMVPATMWQVYATGVTTASADRIEGVTGVAVIEWQPAGGDVFVNGQYMSRLPDHPRHVRLVTFALALPRRTNVLLLGLGGGGMVRDLVHDPSVRRVEVVDWSYELPRLLDTPRARALLDDALRSPKVVVRRCDARVAVSHYEAGRFDVIIDNLTIAHWVGATSVKSVAYFRQLHRILGPAGVLVYHGNWGGARRAILAGLTETFRDVQVHPGRDAVEEVVLASDRPLDIDPAHVARLLDERPISGLASPDGLVGGLTRVTREDVGRSRPVRDDLLVYEYHRDPLRAARQWARSLARRVGAALARPAAGAV